MFDNMKVGTEADAAKMRKMKGTTFWRWEENFLSFAKNGYCGNLIEWGWTPQVRCLLVTPELMCLSISVVNFPFVKHDLIYIYRTSESNTFQCFVKVICNIS